MFFLSLTAMPCRGLGSQINYIIRIFVKNYQLWHWFTWDLEQIWGIKLKT